MNVKRDIRFRVYIAFTCICLLGVAVIVRIGVIQSTRGVELRDRVVEMNTRTTELAAERGNIYTEDGNLLCSSLPEFDVHIDFTVIDKKVFDTQVDSLAACLASLFKDQSAPAYKKKLLAGYNEGLRYWLLKRGLPYYQFQKLRTFPIFNRGKRRGGFIHESKIKRINPYGMLAYRTIGLYRKNSQTVGMEATYDSILHGVSGRRVEQKLTGGVWMPVEGSEVDPHNGRDLVTTIDIGIQGIAEQALLDILKKYESEYGTCIVMEVKTGKIKALVNLGRQKDGRYWEDFNYALVPTEPGSTFKLVTLLALLKDKYVTIDDIVDAENGKYRFGNRTMHDSHHGLHKMTIKEAFAQSSNVAMAKLAFQYYYKEPEKFIEHLRDLHLHERTGIDLKGERNPFLVTPDSKLWSNSSLPWMAIGYAVMISPLHTCMLYNAVANDGKMMRPYLVSAIREYGREIQTFGPTVVEDAIADREAIEQLQAATRQVAITGTGKEVQGPFYAIAGKTGTAQVADKGIKYSDGVYQGSFVGYFPADEPKYTIAVVVRTKPKSRSYYGGTIAAPVFKAVADKIFATGKGWDAPLDSIARNTPKMMLAKQAAGRQYKVLMNALDKNVNVADDNRMAMLVADSNNRISILPGKVHNGFVPDVGGLGLKDAIYLLEKEGLHVEVRGSGRVREQSMAPGTKIIKGRSIVLELS